MKTSKKPTLQEYDDGIINKPEKIELSLLALAEMIENRLITFPAKDNKKAYHLWKNQINSLIAEYNLRVGFKAFRCAH